MIRVNCTIILGVFADMLNPSGLLGYLSFNLALLFFHRCIFLYGDDVKSSLYPALINEMPAPDAVFVFTKYLIIVSG